MMHFPTLRSYLEPQNPQNNSIGGVPGISLFYFEGDVFGDPSIIFVKRIFFKTCELRVVWT